MASPTFDAGFSTRQMTQIFSAESTVAGLLQFESALALALSDLGIAPVDEARQVAHACDAGIDDVESILSSWWVTGTPIVALREAIIPRIESESARPWFHFGATTQDAVDTGASIQATTALDAIDKDLVAMAERLAQITRAHRDQPQMGRTFLTDARAVTFGFRTATWLSAILDHIDEVRMERGSLPVQLGGPTGTRSGYGESGDQLVATLAERLDLATSEVSWQSQRGRVLRRAQVLERTSRSMAKIATDVSHLSALSEITVRSGGSSSMPDKENPIDSVRAIAAASACSGAAAMLTAAPPMELDRGVGGWHIEWLAVPLAFHTAAASVEAMRECIDSLSVDAAVMGADVDDGQTREVTTGVGPQIDRVLQRWESRR